MSTLIALSVTENVQFPKLKNVNNEWLVIILINQNVYNSFVQVLDKTCEHYQRLEEYVRNTHAATHQQFELDVINVSYTNVYILFTL